MGPSLTRRRLVLGTGCLPFAAPAADLVALVAAAKPAVVAVGTYNPTDNPRFGFRGTGFAVAPDRVITCAHVLPPPDDVVAMERLTLLVPRDGRVQELRKAAVVALDRLHDLALLKVEGAPLPAALALAEPGSEREGQQVALIGFPIGGVLGFSPVTHRGIVAAITRAALPAPTSRQLEPGAISRLRDGGDQFEMLQLDATAYPGNSGGPLLDAATGRVLGIVNMVLLKGTRESALSQPTGITYAVPVRFAHELLRGNR